MLILADTNDKLQLVTSAAATIDAVVSYMDCSDASPPVVDAPSSQKTAITTATTTDILAVPGANKRRNVKSIHIRNRHATLACDVTVVLDDNATDYELHKVTLAAGDCLEYIEGVGFFTIVNTTRLDARLYVAADVINATTSFADVTGLTQAVESGKKYAFEAHLYHIENASTTGARFGVNGPAMTNLRIQEMGIFAGSITAATMQGNVADVTALDTAAVVATSSAGTPQVVITILSGGFEPSANGTFAVRCQSEVAVAAGVTVKRGSWCCVWECP